MREVQKSAIRKRTEGTKSMVIPACMHDQLITFVDALFLDPRLISCSRARKNSGPTSTYLLPP